MDFRQWRHVFKLDPEKEISDQNLEKICESGTDAIIVGGTQGVTFDNTIDLMSRVRRFPLPCILEVSQLEAVVPGFDSYFIPLVLNAGDPDWIFGRHVEGLMEYGPLIKWDEIVMEGYIILNPLAEAAKLTKAKANLSVDEAKAFVRLADRMLNTPIIYIEYSGTYGNIELVKEVKSAAGQAHVFYGGGIQTAEQAADMACWADTVVVGNIIYQDLTQALDTVAGVKRV